jgi:hypothetical protein
MSVSNYMHVNHKNDSAKVRNRILKTLADAPDGLTLAETATAMGVQTGCSHEPVHNHLKYCRKMGKVGVFNVEGRGIVYNFIGYFKE